MNYQVLVHAPWPRLGRYLTYLRIPLQRRSAAGDCGPCGSAAHSGGDPPAGVPQADRLARRTMASSDHVAHAYCSR